MIVLISALLGAAIGAFQAKKRGGNRKDIAQYAVGYGIAFTLLGFVFAVVLDRTVL